MSVPYKGPKCNCCGIRQDLRSAPSECDGCDGGNNEKESEYDCFKWNW